MLDEKMLKYITTDRQHKIAQNKKRIDELTTIIKHDEEYKRYSSLTERSKKGLEMLEKEEQEIEEKFQNHNDRNWRRRKSDLIQELANSIEAKEERIKLIEIMLEKPQQKKQFKLFSTLQNRFQSKKKSNSKTLNKINETLEKIKTSKAVVFRSTWKNYYKQKVKTNNEELGQPTMWIEEFVHFTKLYNSVMSKQNKTANSTIELRNNLKNLLVKYSTKQQELIKDKMNIEEELKKVVRFWPADYQKAKKELEETKLMIQESFPIIQKHFNVLSAKRKAQIEEIQALEKQNSDYEAQIINFRSPYTIQTRQQKAVQYIKKAG